MAGTGKAHLRDDVLLRVEDLVVDHLIQLAADEHAATQVRAIAYLKLQELGRLLQREIGRITVEARRAHYVFALVRIERFQKEPSRLPPTRPLPLFGPVS